MNEYRTELIQVAAVAVAMIEDLDTGSADLVTMGDVLVEVSHERAEQNTKWGAQHHDIPMWLTILMEEVGEASQAFLHVVEGLTPGDIKKCRHGFTNMHMGANGEWACAGPAAALTPQEDTE